MSATTPFTSALRNLGQTAIGLVETRIALLSTEWEEERARLGRIWIAASLALFFAVMTSVAIGAFVVVVFWDTHRLLAMGAVIAAFALGTVVSWRVAAHALASKPRLFAATLAALSEDRAALTGRGDSTHA